jgi:hypothetical protein
MIRCMLIPRGWPSCLPWAASCSPRARFCMKYCSFSSGVPGKSSLLTIWRAVSSSASVGSCFSAATEAFREAFERSTRFFSFPAVISVPIFAGPVLATDEVSCGTEDPFYGHNQSIRHNQQLQERLLQFQESKFDELSAFRPPPRFGWRLSFVESQIPALRHN